jgi:hypothetical protein
MSALDIYLAKIMPASSSNEADLCTFATKVPRFKPTKDKASQAQRDRIFHCLQKSIDWLIKHPEAAVDTWTSIDSQQLKAPPALANSALTQCVSGEQKNIFDKPTFGKLDQNARASLYVSLKLATQDSLDKINDHDSHALWDMMTFHFQVAKNDKIPDIMRADTTVFIRAMQIRGDDVNRLTDWFHDSVDAEGIVDWNLKPLHQLCFHEGVLHQVKHISGHPAQVAAHKVITTDFLLVDACSDDLAKMKLGDVEYFLKDLFTKDSGPNEKKLDKAGTIMKSMAEIAQLKIEVQRKAALQIVDAAPEIVSVESRAKRMRIESLEKARAAHKSKVVVRRQVSFSAPVVAALTDLVPPETEVAAPASST